MKRPSGGLGRGLSSLIPGADETAPASGAREVPLDHITRNPYQPRHAIDPTAIEELAASIRAHGVRRLLVYCRRKHGGDWPCHHEGTLPIEQFSTDGCLRDIERVTAGEIAESKSVLAADNVRAF